MEINTKSAVPAKISRAYTKMTLYKDAKSRFSTFQLQMTFSHGYIFSRWKLFVTLEEHVKDAWNNNWKCSHQPMGNLLVLLFFLSSDDWLFYRKLCFGCVDFAPGTLHCKASILFNFPFIGFCDSTVFGRIQNCIVKHVRVVRKEFAFRAWTLNYCLNATNLDMTKISTGFKEWKAQVMHRPRWWSVQLCTTPRQGLPDNSQKLSGFLKVLGMCKFCALFCRNLGHTQVLSRL